MKESKPPTLFAKLLAEAFGTFMLTLTAMGVDILYYTGYDSQGHGVDYVSRWLARGFITAVVIYAFSETSGAHADPAVTLGFALRRVFAWRIAVPYWIAQFAGSFAAAALLLPLYGSTTALGASHPSPRFTPLEAALIEIVLTFMLMLVILMTAQEKPSVGKQAALAVGFTVAACGFFAGPISGASMNPTRSIAPLLLTGQYGYIWIYLVGPAIGAILAVVVHTIICGYPSEEQRKAAQGE